MVRAQPTLVFERVTRHDLPYYEWSVSMIITQDIFLKGLRLFLTFESLTELGKSEWQLSD